MIVIMVVYLRIVYCNCGNKGHKNKLIKCSRLFWFCDMRLKLGFRLQILKLSWCTLITFCLTNHYGRDAYRYSQMQQDR